jgi:AcrR family transcriptional regulator
VSGNTVRDRVVRAAAELLEADPDAFSTRSVSTAAGVQAPTLYRHFGDKEGLVRAAVSWAFEQYLAQKRAQQPTDDPVADLRAGWDVHVGFGLEHPVLYRLMFGDGGASPAARQAEEALARLLGRVADAGRLACSVPRAVALVHGTAVGMVLFTLARPDGERDLAALDAAGDHVVALVTTAYAPPAGEPVDSRAGRRAASLRAALDTDTATAATFTRGERALLTEWLDRLADRGGG